VALYHLSVKDLAKVDCRPPCSLTRVSARGERERETCNLPVGSIWTGRTKRLSGRRRFPHSTMAEWRDWHLSVYLNEPKIVRVATHNVLGIRHSRFEGDPAEVIAHEVAHGAVVRRLGLRAAVALPAWKSEGYAEYQANLATTRADGSYVFTDRVALLLDDDKWSGNPVARGLFEWHVLVEFLAEEQGMDLDALVDENVTEASTREKMLAWYRRGQSAG
jgi:hypothetical protein